MYYGFLVNRQGYLVSTVGNCNGINAGSVGVYRIQIYYKPCFKRAGNGPGGGVNSYSTGIIIGRIELEVLRDSAIAGINIILGGIIV